MYKLISQATEIIRFYVSEIQENNKAELKSNERKLNTRYCIMLFSDINIYIFHALSIVLIY